MTVLEGVARLTASLRGEALAVTDAKGRIVVWSPGARSMTRLSETAVLGKELTELLPPANPALAARLLSTFAEGALQVSLPSGQSLVLRAIPVGDQARVWVFPPDDGSGAALHASEERFRQMVESVKDYAIFLLGPDGRIATWSEGARGIKGYEASEIIGSHISRFYAPEDQAAELPQRLLKEAEREGRVEHEGWRVRKDGTRFWADVVITAVRNRDGQLLGFTKVTRDLSTRRAAEEALRQSEERFRLLVASVKDYAIFMLDTDGRVATWNAGAEALKGYRAEEIIGSHISRFYPPEIAQSGYAERLLARARDEGRVEDEGFRVRKDGTRFWADVVLTALRQPDGTLIGYAKVTRDLTDRRKLEEERVRRAEAEAAIRMRDEFLSIASHELKTPLTSVQLQLEALVEKTRGTPGGMFGRLERARRASERLSELIETLLDVSRIATGRFELKRERLDLREVTREVVDRMAEAAAYARSTVTLEPDGPLIGVWDRLRVEQLLMNLLSNAFKYAAGTPVRITLAREGDQARLEVRDQGPGIDEADLSRIFGRFERAASMRHYGGLGLGLYVNREIAHALGGSIEGRNAPGGGALFVVRLPLEPREGGA